MQDRYNKKVAEFFDVARGKAIESGPVLDARGNWHKLLSNPDANLTALNLPLDTFTIRKGDYRVYYAFLAAYYATIHHYTYRTVSDLKDENLENALDEWNRVTNAKPNFFAKLVRGIKK